MEILLAKLNAVSAFRNLLEDPAVKSAMALMEHMNRRDGTAEMLKSYGALLAAVRSDRVNTLSEYLDRHLRFDHSAFGFACSAGEADEFYIQAAKCDFLAFAELAAWNFKELKKQMAELSEPQFHAVIAGLPELPAGKALSFEDTLDSYRHHGVGLFALGRAFRWEKGTLTMVKNPDPIDESDMIGYQWQREEVVDNTRALIEGRPASNVLLYGHSGTGKSATVKSLLNMPEFYNLRIIEVAKSSLDEITMLIRTVSAHTQKFVLYIDDLTFENEDKGYSALKTALEGGLELRPDNVAIYATSNRRHMIRESFADRAGDDVHASETLQERTSLSERFGLRIPFMALDKQAFLDMVAALAAHEGLSVPREELDRQANQWEIQHGGRTPRIARQFLDSLHSRES